MITREDSLRLKDVKLAHFGRSKSISLSKTWTTIVGGKGNRHDVDKQIQSLKNEIQQTDSLKECERIQERITRLASGIAVIRVGAATEVEMIEKKHRIDDALEAVRSAQEMGIVSGGGSALIHITKSLNIETDNDDQDLGAKIVLEACEAPLRQMCLNAGESPDLIVDMVKTSEHGQAYDFMSRKIIDTNEKGLLDPVKVTTCALENAVSVASTLITTNYAVVKN